MSFFDDAETTDCEMCGAAETTGHGSYNEVTGRYTFYLCAECAAKEAQRDAEKIAADMQRQAKAIAMHNTMS